MGFRTKKVEVLVLHTKDQVIALASKLKSLGGTECERDEKESRKAKIKSKILGGEMRPFHWAVGEVTEDGPNKGLRRRVDGQHSSEVFLELTPEEWGKVGFPVMVVWEDDECDTIRDLPTLFEQFNPPWSSRNTEDLIGAHFGIHQDLKDLVDESGPGRHVVARVTKGMAWHAEKVEGKPKDSARQFEIVHDNHDTHAFLLWCGSFLSRQKTAEMFHPAVVGAMRHTFDASDLSANDFWKQVAGGKATNEEGSPAYKLAVFLEMLADDKAEWPRTISKHFNRSSTKPNQAQVFATCLNAFRGDRSGKRLGDIFDPVKGKSVKEVAADFEVLLKKPVA